MSDELARWYDEAEVRTRQYQAVQAEVARMTATGSSDDGKITVTVDAGGAVTDLRIGGDTRLAAEILTAMRRAQARIPELVTGVMRAGLGDGAAESAFSAYRAKFPDVDPAPGEPARTGGSEDGEEMGFSIRRVEWS